MLLLKSGRLFPFFKVQTGLALACGFVKGALLDKFLFFGDCCPCRVQTVGGFVGFPHIIFKLRRCQFFIRELQTGRFLFRGSFMLRPLCGFL